MSHDHLVPHDSQFKKLWELRLAAELQAALHIIDQGLPDEAHLEQLTLWTHRYLTEHGILSDGVRFRGFIGDSRGYVVPDACTKSYPYPPGDGIFDRAKDFVTKLFGQKLNHQTQDFVIPTYAIPNLLAVMIAHASDGRAGGGDESSGSQDDIFALCTALKDRIAGTGLKLPSVDPSHKGAIWQSLCLQPIETPLPDQENYELAGFFG